MRRGRDWCDADAELVHDVPGLISWSESRFWSSALGVHRLRDICKLRAKEKQNKHGDRGQLSAAEYDCQLVPSRALSARIVQHKPTRLSSAVGARHEASG